MELPTGRTLLPHKYSREGPLYRCESLDSGPLASHSDLPLENLVDPLVFLYYPVAHHTQFLRFFFWSRLFFFYVPFFSTFVIQIGVESDFVVRDTLVTKHRTTFLYGRSIRMHGSTQMRDSSGTRNLEYLSFTGWTPRETFTIRAWGCLMNQNETDVWEYGCLRSVYRSLHMDHSLYDVTYVLLFTGDCHRSPPLPHSPTTPGSLCRSRLIKYGVVPR